MICSNPLKLLTLIVWQRPGHRVVVSVTLALFISSWPWLCLFFVHSLPQPASLFQRHKQKNGTLNLNRTASGRVELQSVLSRRFPPPWHTLVEVENNWIKETAPSLCNTSDFNCSAVAMRLNWLQLTNDLSPYCNINYISYFQNAYTWNVDTGFTWPPMMNPLHIPFLVRVGKYFPKTQ